MNQLNVTMNIIFFILHLTISLKSNDFCIVKQQDCKGFYDKDDNYKTKCEPVMCHGKYKIIIIDII
jgi:hypothetical protein